MQTQPQFVSSKEETEIQQSLLIKSTYVCVTESAKGLAGKRHWLSSEVMGHRAVWSCIGRQTVSPNFTKPKQRPAGHNSLLCELPNTWWPRFLILPIPHINTHREPEVCYYDSWHRGDYYSVFLEHCDAMRGEKAIMYACYCKSTQIEVWWVIWHTIKLLNSLLAVL